MDPVRRRPAPLRRRRLRHDATEGDLLGPATCEWEFELAQPSDTYRNDHSKMVVQLQQPCVVRYRRRSTDRPFGTRTLMRVSVDLDLCQGHGVCESEAPTVFRLAKNAAVTILDESPGEQLRARSRAAVRYCPTSALRIDEEE